MSSLLRPMKLVAVQACVPTLLLCAALLATLLSALDDELLEEAVLEEATLELLALALVALEEAVLETLLEGLDDGAGLADADA